MVVSRVVYGCWPYPAHEDPRLLAPNGRVTKKPGPSAGKPSEGGGIAVADTPASEWAIQSPVPFGPAATTC